jgi:hypothetical protein
MLAKYEDIAIPFGLKYVIMAYDTLSFLKKVLEMGNLF